MSGAYLVFDAEMQPYISQQGASDLLQAKWTGKGYALYTPNTATLLTDSPDDGTALPPDARHAIISVKGGGIRVRTDGTNPTASTGLYIPAGTLIRFTNQRQILLQWRMIDSTAETSEISTAWFA